MELKDWLKRRLKYNQKATARDLERANIGAAADEDIPYYVKTVEEVLIDILDRLEKIEELYKPAPEFEKPEKAPTVKYT